MTRKNEWTLLNDRNEPVKVGDKLKSFRGEVWTVESWEPPHKTGSTGRVYCTRKGPKGAVWMQGFFPTVFNALFVRHDQLPK